MSKMNGGQLRHAMKQVHMKENMQEEIIMNVRTQMADGTYRRNSFKRMAMSATAFMLVFGAVSIPSYAAISNLVRARPGRNNRCQFTEKSGIRPVSPESRLAGIGHQGCVSHGVLKRRNGTYQYIWRKKGT